jgi:hypothetical protein
MVEGWPAVCAGCSTTPVIMTCSAPATRAAPPTPAHPAVIHCCDALRAIEASKRCSPPSALTPCCSGQHSTAQHSTAQHSTAQHSTAQHSRAQHSTAQHSIAQHSTAQHSTAQHSTAQHSIAQHSTAQHSTAQHSWWLRGCLTAPVIAPASRCLSQSLTCCAGLALPFTASQINQVQFANPDSAVLQHHGQPQSWHEVMPASVVA